MRRAELRQVGIEEAEGMRRFDDANASGTLLFDNLIAKGLHPRPMDLRPEMMFGVVAVEEPDPVIKLVVAAHAPGDRLIGIAAVMAVVTVQVREAMAEVPEADQEDNVVPVQDAERDERSDEKNQLEHAPERLPFVLAHGRAKIGVVNEVVRDAVDVPGNADRIDESENQHDPERRVREQEEHPKEIGEMEQFRPDRNDVPARERKNPGISLEPLCGDVAD